MYSIFHQVRGYVVAALSLRVLHGVVLVEGERNSVHCDTVSTSLQPIRKDNIPQWRSSVGVGYPSPLKT